jgi:hypothetical protein
MSFYTTQSQSSHVDVTQYVQDVVDGIWVNNGFQINVDSQGQGGWKRIVSLDEDNPANVDLLPHLDVTWETSETTGAGSDDVTLAPQDLGYTQADADGRNAQLQAYDTRDPNGLVGPEYLCADPCTGGSIPAAQGLSHAYASLREQRSYYCVPAVVQSMLNYFQPSANWANGDTTIAGVTQKQETVATAIVAARNAGLPGPDIPSIPKQNGIDPRWGLKVLNDDLNGSYRYILTSAQSVSDLRDKIKLTIHFNDAPVFMEVDLRSKNWAYSFSPWKLHNGVKGDYSTHVITAIAYGNSGATFTIADPYPTSTNRHRVADYWQLDNARPGTGTYDRQIPGPNGVKWTGTQALSDLDLYGALASVNWQLNPKNDMWY